MLSWWARLVLLSAVNYCCRRRSYDHQTGGNEMWELDKKNDIEFVLI